MTKPYDIAGFGDSFVWGSEIPKNIDGSLAWPGIAAKNLNCSYKSFAVPGCGNDNIARQLYSYYSEPKNKKTLAVVNWTWSQRWDFYITEHETWITLGPTCVPKKLEHLVDQTQSVRLVEFYRDYAGKSLTWNKFRNLQTIYAAQQFLNSLGIDSVQTYMDHQLFDQEYHAPDYIKLLQDLIKPSMQLFNGQNFLDWSYTNGYEVTKGGLHPLQSAHENAAALWQPVYESKLKEINDQSI